MNILVDAMGGDNAPEEIVKGAVQSINESNGFEVTIIGIEDRIKNILKEFHYDEKRLKIVNATEVITNEDIPTKAIKTKKNSSMAVGLDMIKKNQGDAFISAGNTGALMTGSLLLLGRIKGVDRPALPFFFPADKGPVVIIDAGANTVCKPINYYQFAIMGATYLEKVLGIKNPKIGLLNVGTEDSKGNDSVKGAHAFIKDKNFNYLGNIEGRDIPSGKADVVLCDGFIGNIILKYTEGMGGYFFDGMKTAFKKNMITKLSALLVKKSLKDFKKKFDYTEYGGVPLLGINGMVIKCHGSSNSKTMKNAIIRAVDFIKSDTLNSLRNKFANMGDDKIG